MRLRVEHLVVGAHVGRVEGLRKRVEGEAEVVVDRDGMIEDTGLVKGPCVLDAKVPGRVVLEVLRAGLDAARIESAR